MSIGKIADLNDAVDLPVSTHCTEVGEPLGLTSDPTSGVAAVILRPRRQPGRLGLHRRISLFVAIGLLLSLAIFGILGVQAVSETTDRELQERLLLAEMAAGQLDRTLEGTLRAIEALAATSGLDPATGEIGFDLSTLHTLRAQTDPRSYRLDLLRLDGKVVATEPFDPSLVGLQLIPAATTARVDESGTGAIVTFHDVGSGKQLVALVAPIHDRGGRIVGLLSGDFDLSDPSMLGFLKPVQLGATGGVQIVDEHGNLLSSFDNSASDDLPNHARFAELVAGGVPTVGVCHDCHVTGGATQRRQDVMAFAPLSNAPLGILLRQASDEAFATTQELRWQMVGFGIFLLIGGLLLAQLMTRSVVKPIEALTRAARQIAHGDLTSPVPGMGHSEIAVLSDTFDDMRERLRQSLAEIERWNETLEHRVAQRTHELASLLQAANSLTMTLDLDTLLSLILEGAAETFSGTDAGTLMLYDRTQSVLVVHASVGFDPAAFQRLRLRPGESIAGQVFAMGREMSCESGAEIEAARANLSDFNRHQIEMAEASLPHPASCICAPLVIGNHPMGSLLLLSATAQSFTSSDLRLLRAMADQAAVAVDNAQLYEEVRRSEEARGELLAKLIGAQEEERHRIARELHDETSQALTALVLSLAQLRKVTPASLSNVHEGFDEIEDLAGMTLDEIHRLVYDLRPTLLDDLGLVPAIQWYLETHGQKAGIALDLELDGMEERLPAPVETVLFRIIQEAVTNVVRHADATRATVRVSRKNGAVSVVIEDNGNGFDTKALTKRGEKAGVGLLGIRERVHLLGGIFNIVSRPGSGTKLSVDVSIAVKDREHDQSTVG